MNIFLLFFAFLWFAMLAVFVLSLPVLGTIGYFKKSWKFFGISSGLSFLVFCLGSAALWALVTFLYRPYDPETPKELARAFETDFGEPPPTGITVLKARQYCIADSGIQWLLLGVEDGSIDKILAYGFTPSHSSQEFTGTAGANAPDWWTPALEDLEYYGNPQWPHGQSWATNYASIAIDRRRKEVWVVINRID